MVDCKKGNHQFIKILRITIGEDEEKVVRWCKKFGAIIIDLDMDGRIYPGYYMRCCLPENETE